MKDNRPLGVLWNSIQNTLFPELEETLGTLTEKEREFIRVCELCAPGLVRETRRYDWQGQGRPPAERLALAKAFMAKAVYNLGTTELLIEYLHGSVSLRRLCGWESAAAIPSKATFSRAFGAFAAAQLPERVHAEIIKAHGDRKLVGHLSRDATAIVAREHAAKPEPKPKEEGMVRRRGRPRDGEERPAPEPKRLEQQSGRSLAKNLAELPRSCAWGCKRNSDGKKEIWKGYKLHADVADGELPVSLVLTSASLHDSQAAIPLAQMSAERVRNLYDLMDSAYDAKEIRQYSEQLTHVAIIDPNRRGGEAVSLEPAQQRRFAERSSAERFFAYLEYYGAYQIWVRGAGKVMCHLMFAVLALTAHQLYQMLL